MLQFVTKHSEIDKVRQAIEGGCAWVELKKDENDPDFRTALAELMNLCKETETILTIQHDVELSNELKIHGVHLFPGDMTPREAREYLGPHAIIGVEADNVEEILALRGLDVDYVTVGPFPSKFGFNEYSALIKEVRKQGFEIPIVARGEIKPDDILMLKGAGINGVAVSNTIADADNPAKMTAEILGLLMQ